MILFIGKVYCNLDSVLLLLMLLTFNRYRNYFEIDVIGN